MSIPDPTKSWAIYGELHEGKEAHYYRFEIVKGEKIYISLMKPTDPENKEFMPGFVLMGPGLIERGTISDYIEQPPVSNAIILVGKQPSEATYEPFTPSSFFQLAELDIPAPESGRYYIAVYEPTRGGHYSLAVGKREVFSLTEWILIPMSLISIYQWEGQSLFMIFSPIVVVFTIAVGIWWKKRGIPLSLFELGGLTAGLLFLGTGFVFLSQMVISVSQTPLAPEIVITIILAIIPILLGIAVIRIILKNREKVDLRKRAYLAILGIIAFFVWAGFLIGPAFALMAFFLSDRKSNISDLI
jgi:hypothetical protein